MTSRMAKAVPSSTARARCEAPWLGVRPRKLPRAAAIHLGDMAPLRAGMKMTPSHPGGASAALAENASSPAIESSPAAQRTAPPESQPGLPR